MTINLDYLDNLNPKRLEILKEQIKNSHDIETLRNIPENYRSIYYCAKKRLFELENIAFKETEFVAIGNSKNKLIKIIVFKAKNPNNHYTKKIKELLKFDFDAIFNDENFDGDSYNLAMYVAAYALMHNKNIKENYCFSGIIDESLKIKTPGLQEKQKYANSKNKILIGENLNLHEILNQVFMPDRKLILARNEQLSVPGFKVLNVGNLPKIDWTSTIKQAAKFIEPFDEVAFNCPASFAFGIGAYLGSIYPYKVLHFQSGQYLQALDTDRELKTIDYNFSELVINTLESAPKELNILLHFASHEPTAPTNKPTIKIEAKVKGNIPIENYKETTRQINNAINYLKRQYQFKKVNLVLSMPVAMAFALGCAIGKFLNASVYHYFFDSGSYFKVFNLSDLS
ncbi:SAVED domain-containing protein [Desulfurella multipotens]|uniref:SAVED domain-containing protein n=1 Tax=Desulfurella multipotens TaxID=79269 RepID=UPI000CAE7A4E|nr:SAVED domain-containing protein [Desulfurella multipotens]PMP65195.1 MAG: hypothetical protein C0192_05575 [Desulfurella multipotens]